jgi:CBS domain-containing protein
VEGTGDQENRELTGFDFAKPEQQMKAGDIMSPRVISVTPDASIQDAIQLMLDKRISGLPVIDSTGTLVGVVTEGDFLRRAETSTERKRSRWLEILLGPQRLADEYVREHGRKVEDVMTRDPVTVEESAPLDEVVRVMERRRIKRLPVVRGTQVVGIVSRANLLHALASLGRETPAPAKSDSAIREQLLAAFHKEVWAPVALIDVVVKNGVVELWGTILDKAQGEGLKVLAENTPGVAKVVSHLTWIEPMTGMVMEDEGETAQQNSAPKNSAPKNSAPKA